MSRYEASIFAAIGIQARRLAVRPKAKIVGVYHVVGTVMEMFKTGFCS